MTQHNASHTPGPWTVVDGQDMANPFTVRAPLGNIPYGLMGDYRGNIVADIKQNGADPLSGMAEANARLMAAAPDLYDALRAVYDMVVASSHASHFLDGFSIGDDGLPHANVVPQTPEDRLLHVIEAALSKADAPAVGVEPTR